MYLGVRTRYFNILLIVLLIILSAYLNLNYLLKYLNEESSQYLPGNDVKPWKMSSKTNIPGLPDKTIVQKSYSHNFIIVMVLSHLKHIRLKAKKYWYNEQFWRSRNVSIKILYVVGIEENNTSSIENDLIFTNLTESRSNLVFKVKEGMRYIHDNYDFDYILKTDIDVFHNFKLWQTKLLDHNTQYPDHNVLYGGARCMPHPNVSYRWCSGMGYVVHHSVVQQIVSYPSHLMEIPEDRNTGKIMKESKVEMFNFASGMLQTMKNHCVHLNEILQNTASLHLGYGNVVGEERVRCWKNSKFSFNESANSFI